MARRRGMLAPINTIKHYVPRTRITIGVGTINVHQIVSAVAQNNVVNVQDVVEGAIIKAIYMELWIHPDDSASARQFIVTLEKISSGGTQPIFADLLNLQGYTNKKNVLYTSQGLLGDSNAQGALPIIRQWIAIPKGKQRFTLGDQFVISFAAVDGQFQECGMFIFKEYK